MISIAPSILSADLLRLGDELESIIAGGADAIHVDVMDGHFVPNLTMGPNVVGAVKQIGAKNIDVHLMIDNPDCYIDSYIDAGADVITIHAEACTHLHRCLSHIKSRNVKAGVALNPSTHESCLTHILDYCDVILVMSVNPGFSGQKFIPSSIEKIAGIRAMLKSRGKTNCTIAVDGGITYETIGPCIKAGASFFVAGSYIFSQPNYGKAIKKLKSFA